MVRKLRVIVFLTITSYSPPMQDISLSGSWYSRCLARSRIENYIVATVMSQFKFRMIEGSFS